MFTKMVRAVFDGGNIDDLGASKKEIENLFHHEKFSDYLPWICYDEEKHQYIGADDGTGFIWECSPLCFSTEKTLQMSEAILRLPMPMHSVVQFVLHADPNIKPIIRGFKYLRRNCEPMVHEAADRYSNFLWKCTAGLKRVGGIPLRNYRLFVVIKLPDDAKISEDNREKIQGGMKELLTGLGLWPIEADPNLLVEWLRRLMNGSVPEQIRPNGDETAGTYNPIRPISKQVLFAETDVSIESDHIRMGEKHWVCMTPKSYPMEVDPLETSSLFGGVWGMRSDGSQITTPFLYSLNIVIDNLKGPIRRKCDLLLMQGTIGSFARSLARKQAESTWAVDKIDHQEIFARVMPVMWFNHEDLQRAKEVRTRAKNVWESAGYVMQEDKGMLAAMWISALPMGLRVTQNNLNMLERDTIAPADAIMNILPIQADFSGSNEPVFLFQGRKGQIIPMSIFSKRADNYNGFIAAASGKGKSFLMNFLAFNGRATGVKLRVVDLGGSYEKLCSMSGGRYIDFADSKNQNLCMNPFSNIKVDPDEDIQAISYIVMQMVYASMDNPSPPKEEYVLAKEACQWAYDQKGNDASMDDVFQFLSEYPKHTVKAHTGDIQNMAHHMAFSMADYTSKGNYGQYFVGKSTFSITDDDFVVLELDALRNNKELFKVITLLVLDAAQKDLYLSDRADPRQVIFDEAWQFLTGSNKMMMDIIESGYRRARKYHGSFFVITQSLLDRKRFGDVGDIIWSQADFKFMLESSDFAAAEKAGLIDYDPFTMEMLKSLKTNAPAYSEIFCDTPFGRGVVRLAVDDYSYYIYTSHPKENAEMMAMVRDGMSWPDTIHAMIKKYRSK